DPLDQEVVAAGLDAFMQDLEAVVAGDEDDRDRTAVLAADAAADLGSADPRQVHVQDDQARHVLREKARGLLARRGPDHEKAPLLQCLHIGSALRWFVLDDEYQ